MKLFNNHDPETIAKIWTVFCFLILSGMVIIQNSGYLQFDIITIWVLSCIAILYLSRKETGRYTNNQQKVIIFIGVLICLLSFTSISLGITNPPYSIGEFTLLISGIGVILFGLFNFRSLILPVSIPFIAVIGFSAYELFIRNQDWITAPIIPYIVTITIILLHALGVPAVAHGNIISFMSQTGSPIYLSIVSDCTGIWSMGTFTVAVIVILSSFPNSITRKSLGLIAIGYIGTFCANIIRILMIALSGFFYGPVGVMENMHVHIGWICFSLWMIIFWYYFFTRQLGVSFFRKTQIKQDNS